MFNSEKQTMMKKTNIKVINKILTKNANFGFMSAIICLVLNWLVHAHVSWLCTKIISATYGQKKRNRKMFSRKRLTRFEKIEFAKTSWRLRKTNWKNNSFSRVYKKNFLESGHFWKWFWSLVSGFSSFFHKTIQLPFGPYFFIWPKKVGFVRVAWEKSEIKVVFSVGIFFFVILTLTSCAPNFFSSTEQLTYTKQKPAFTFYRQN